MLDKIKEISLKVAILTSVATYLFWEQMPKGSFYIGIALTFFFLSLHIFLTNKTLWTFFFLSIAINNLIDEIILDPSKLNWSELSLVIVLPIIYYKYVRKK